MPSTVPGTRREFGTHLLDEGIAFLWNTAEGQRAQVGRPRRARLRSLGSRVGVGEWVCAGVCAVERASEPGARSGEEQSALRRTRSVRPAGQLGGGWAVPPARPRGPHWPPAGRPPPGRRRGAEGLLPSRRGSARPSRRRGGRVGSAPPIRPLPALLPPPGSGSVSVSRAAAHGRPPTAPEGPGQLPGARVSGRARSPAPPGPRRLLLLSRRRRGAVCPGSAQGNRKGRGGGGGTEGRSGVAARGLPLPRGPGGNRWRGAGRALCVGARRPGAGGRASLGLSLSSPAPPGGRTRGRPGNGAESPGMCLWGLPGSREGRGWPRWPGSAGAERWRGGRCAATGWRGMLPARRVPPGRGLDSSAASPEVGSWVGVCVEKGEAGRPVTSGAGSVPRGAPCFRGRGPWGAVVPGPTRARAMRGWGRPWRGFNKGCSSPPGGEGQLERGGPRRAALSWGRLLPFRVVILLLLLLSF